MPRNPIKRIKVILNYALQYKKNKFKKKSLIIDGDIALSVGNNNYKIIRLKDRVIYTIYDEHNESYILRSLRFNKSSLMYEKIYDVDIENRIIKGRFYNGHHPNLINASINNHLRDKISDMFINLLYKSAIKEVESHVYAKFLLSKSLGILNRNSGKLSEEQIETVKSFIKIEYEKFIKSYSRNKIILTFSHGDIKQDNLLEVNNEIVLIDWEFCEFRTPFYDFLKFKARFPFLGEEFYDYILERINRYFKESDINNLLSDYFYTHSINNKELFYLEDVYLRLIQFETRQFASDFSRIIRFIKGVEV